MFPDLSLRYISLSRRRHESIVILSIRFSRTPRSKNIKKKKMVLDLLEQNIVRTCQVNEFTFVWKGRKQIRYQFCLPSNHKEFVVWKQGVFCWFETKMIFEYATEGLSRVEVKPQRMKEVIPWISDHSSTTNCHFEIMCSALQMGHSFLCWHKEVLIKCLL